MPYRRTIRYLSALDGTRLAWHTHTGALPAEQAESVLTTRPAVLLTNGMGTTEAFWRYLVGSLEQDHRVVHWDYRGHGHSEVAATGDYALRTYVEDLERVTEEVRGSGGPPPHHVAFSLGVRVVLELYRRRPDLVRSMTLIAGSPATPDPGSLVLGRPGGRLTLAALLRALEPLLLLGAPVTHAIMSSHLMYPLGRLLGVVRASAPREDIEELLRSMARMDPRAQWLTLRDLLETPPAWDVLPQVRVPVQIVAARHDWFAPLHEMERMRREVPHAQWVLVEEAGHATLLEAGAEIAEEVRVFREACSQGAGALA
jgi:pimeloyl-ACP methyl ester carboxylesterase